MITPPHAARLARRSDAAAYAVRDVWWAAAVPAESVGSGAVTTAPARHLQLAGALQGADPAPVPTGLETT